MTPQINQQPQPQQQPNVLVNRNGGPVEELLVLESVAQFITKYVDKNAFFKWIDQVGCDNVTRGAKSHIWVLLNGRSMDENNDHLGHILDVMKEAQIKLKENDPEDRNGMTELSVILRLYIPREKFAFVRGRDRENLNKIQEDYEVRAYSDDGRLDPVPEGFIRLVLRSGNAEGLRMARIHVGELVRMADRNNATHQRINAFEMAQREQDLARRLHSHSTELLVPVPEIRCILGKGGENIKKLALQFKVKLEFLGENFADYPNGRPLRISGMSEQQVEKAKLYIQQQFGKQQCSNYREMGDNWRQQQKEAREQEEPDVQMEMNVPVQIGRKALKMEIQHKIVISGPRPRADGTQLLVLKGKRAYVEAARDELELATNELAKKSATKKPEMSTSTSGSGGKSSGSYLEQAWKKGEASSSNKQLPEKSIRWQEDHEKNSQIAKEKPKEEKHTKWSSNCSNNFKSDMEKELALLMGEANEENGQKNSQDKAGNKFKQDKNLEVDSDFALSENEEEEEVENDQEEDENGQEEEENGQEEVESDQEEVENGQEEDEDGQEDDESGQEEVESDQEEEDEPQIVMEVKKEAKKSDLEQIFASYLDQEKKNNNLEMNNDFADSQEEEEKEENGLEAEEENSPSHDALYKVIKEVWDKEMAKKMAKVMQKNEKVMAEMKKYIHALEKRNARLEEAMTMLKQENDRLKQKKAKRFPPGGDGPKGKKRI